MTIVRKFRAVLKDITVGESQIARHRDVGPHDRPTGFRHTHRSIRMHGGW